MKLQKIRKLSLTERWILLLRGTITWLILHRNSIWQYHFWHLDSQDINRLNSSAYVAVDSLFSNYAIHAVFLTSDVFPPVCITPIKCFQNYSSFFNDGRWHPVNEAWLICTANLKKKVGLKLWQAVSEHQTLRLIDFHFHCQVVSLLCSTLLMCSGMALLLLGRIFIKATSWCVSIVLRKL